MHLLKRLRIKSQTCWKMIDNFKNPWHGLKSYEEEENLYGRDQEANDIANIIINGFSSIIYGKSGIGKTSLLKAGVFPILKYEDFYPIYIRLEHNNIVGNLYEDYLIQIDNSLKQVKSGIIVSEKNDEIKTYSLQYILNHYIYKTSKDIKLTPVFVFDQFEELFTLVDFLDTCSVDKFFKDISVILNNYSEVQNFRLVFCIREDYLYCIERHSEYIPAFKRNRYYLQDLSSDEAYEVITKPRKGLVNKDVARNILQLIESGVEKEVNATILSLYMSQLYDKMQSCGDKSITSEIIHQFGDNIIVTFYYDSIKEISNKTISYLENHLVTNGGYRHNIPLDDALEAGVQEAEIEVLKNKRILHVQSKANKVLYIEFTHDVLCPIIVKHRNERIVKEKADITKKNILKKFLLFTLLLFVIFLLVWYSSRQKSAEAEARRQKESADSILALKDFIQIQKDSIEGLNCCLKNTIDSLRLSDKEKNKHIETIEEEKIKLKVIIESEKKAQKDKERAIKERENAEKDKKEAEKELIYKEKQKKEERLLQEIINGNDKGTINFNLNP